MTTTEKNKLIVEFMEAKFGDNKYSHESSEYYFQAIELEYHESWSWLMPVVERIESIEGVHGGYQYNVQIEQSFVCIIDNRTSEEIIDLDRDTKLEAVYEAVVEFLIWLNNS